MKEKLIELFGKALLEAGDGTVPFEKIADYLIANGVAVQEWISVKDRLPEPETEVLAYRGGFIGDMMDVYTYLRVGVWQDTYGYTESTDGEGITHWMQLPTPPKDGDSE